MVSEQSNFLNHAVDVQVEWPGKQTEFKFGNFTITALPATNEFDPSLPIDIHRYSISVVEAMTILSRLLSIAVWLDDR